MDQSELGILWAGIGTLTYSWYPAQTDLAFEFFSDFPAA